MHHHMGDHYYHHSLRCSGDNAIDSPDNCSSSFAESLGGIWRYTPHAAFLFTGGVLCGLNHRACWFAFSVSEVQSHGSNKAGASLRQRLIGLPPFRRRLLKLDGKALQPRRLALTACRDDSGTPSCLKFFTATLRHPPSIGTWHDARRLSWMTFPYCCAISIAPQYCCVRK